jgi:protein pelota
MTADSQLAVAELLVTDKLFKSANPLERRMYVTLVESVRDHGGRVFIFSSMHVSGEQLDRYTGVAATLRFPLPPTVRLDEGYTSSSSDNNDDERQSDGFEEWDFVKS